MKKKGIYKITWEDPEYNWKYFRLLEELECGCMRFRGVADMEDGTPHDGSEFTCRPKEIKRMVWKKK